MLVKIVRGDSWYEGKVGEEFEVIAGKMEFKVVDTGESIDSYDCCLVGVEKYVNSYNMVGIIVSYGYGSGWSSHAYNVSGEDRENLIFDKEIVEAIRVTQNIYQDVNKEAIREIVQRKYPGFGEVHDSILDGLTVEFVRLGEEFYIDDNDGDEAVVFKYDIKYYKA